MKTQISFDNFQKLDIRIGTIIKAEVPKWSHWVIKLTVDFGPEIGQKICFAGIMHFFQPKDLIGKQFPFLVNLLPRPIGPEGSQSEVMLLAAAPPVKKPLIVTGEAVTERCVLLEPQEKLPNGTRLK